jgi:peroxiredoxin
VGEPSSQVALVSVNDHFVMKAWSESLKAGDKARGCRRTRLDEGDW